MTIADGLAAKWGDLPPWMQPHPGHDEAEYADREQDRTDREQARARLLAERFGPTAAVARERNRSAAPLTSTTNDAAEVAARNRLLERALQPATARGRRAA